MSHQPRRFALEALESRDVPAAHLAAVGADAGGNGSAQLVDAATGLPRYNVFPFGPSYSGAVRVAAADVTGDGITDLIAAPGAGGGPVVKVFDGLTGAEVRNALVFDEGFRGGLYVAAADTNLDGFADIVVGAGEGGGPAMAVIDGATGNIPTRLFAFADGFRGGVRVAAADVDADGRAEVVAGAGPGGGSHVKAFNVAAGTPTVVASFFAYDPAFTGGVFVAAGDLDQDGVADIVTGTGEGGGPLVRGFHADGTGFVSFLADDANARAGVRVGVIDAGGGYALDVATVVPTAPGAPTGRFSAAGVRRPAGGPAGGWVSGPSESTGDAAMLWNRVALRAIQADATPPPAAARVLAMTHLAVFDAVNHIDPRYNSYFSPDTVPEGADPETAALIAGEQVLSALYPTRADRFVAIRDAHLALIPESQAKADGISVGLDAASRVVFVRSFDGAAGAATFPFTPGTNPGDWRPTPPANAPFQLPGWGNVNPFGIPFPSFFRPAGPPDLGSPEYAADINTVQQLGSATSTVRTADQTQTALFWRAGYGTVTPPGMANVIAEQVVRRENLDLLDSARTFALVNIATADAGIVSWDAKLAFQRWRPITAIRAADTDGNPTTTADPTWSPLLTTPSHPDYTSGHSTFSSAAAAVLEGLFGADYPFRTYSQDLPGVSRGFTGFAAFAAEAGMSRVYGGIHTPSANQDGLSSGRAVGEYVLENNLQPQPG